MSPRLLAPAAIAFVLFTATLLLLFGVGPTSETHADRAPPEAAATDGCVECHQKVNPGIVSQWQASKHAAEDVACDVCHGLEHRTADDAYLAGMPTAATCATCHPDQVKQFAGGKHALAWDSVKAIPMMANQPAVLGEKSCYACHLIGKKHADGSIGKCDSCHTRHLFSKKEAQRPEACETCHMGEDHSQYEMWRSSKHGVIHHLTPDSGRAPVCQTCHMDAGNHAVKTGWGFLALRLPIHDKVWADAQMKVLKAIGPWGWDDKGMADRVGAIKALDLARLSDEEFQAKRREMIAICSRCHSRNYVAEHLAAGDKLIRESTLVMAEGIDAVQALYNDGVLPKTKDGPKHADLLLFYDSPTPIEQELYEMFLFHRQKLFQGVMHTNPDYAHWYGWAKMKTSLVKIKAMAAAMRK